MEATEQELSARSRAGDEDALTELLQRTGPQVRAVISTLIDARWQNVLDADDVMQVTYLEAFLRITRFEPRGDGSFQAWLLQIARNNVRDAVEELGRLKRPPPDQRVIAGGDESAVALLDQLGCTSTTPSRHAGRHEIASAVHSAVGRLPDDYARVIQLYDLEGKGAEEVAASIGRTSGAVYMLRARAHDRLREAFGSISQY